MKDKYSKNNTIKKQSITMVTILGKAIEAIVAYVVLFFFKPVWDRLVEWWNNKDNDNNK